MLMRKLSPISVANYLLKKDENLTPLKLLKLVYMCHGWHLAIYDKPLFREKVEAWAHGPVFPSLYYAVHNFVAGPVFYPIGNGEGTAKPTGKQKELIDEVYDTYHHLDTWAMSDLTHDDYTPWAKTWRKHRQIGIPISNDLIKEYYREFTDNG